MKKNILIISSNFTGHGHKSITESLIEKFALYPDVSVHVVDGFNLGGNAMLRIGKLYGSVTRNAKELWKMMWEISSRKPSLVNDFTEITIRDNLIKLLKTIKPDLILSVHPNFNGSVLNIMEDYNIRIPFVVLIADLVSLSPLWAEPKADYIICPTKESKYKCLEFGVSESKLNHIGFPVRSRFLQHLENNYKEKSYNTKDPLQILIMSGGEGSGNMSRIAKILLKNFNCNVKIVAGRNKILRRRLERSLYEKYGNRVEIFGFTENIQDLMLASDVGVTRGSPNVMMEAVACNLPLIVTGNLPGQEEGNPWYLLKHNLGVVCKDPRNLKNIMNELLVDNAYKLNEIKNSQRNFRDPNVAKKIVDFLVNIDLEADYDLSGKIPKFWDFSKRLSSFNKKIIVKRHKG